MRKSQGGRAYGKRLKVIRLKAVGLAFTYEKTQPIDKLIFRLDNHLQQKACNKELIDGHREE